MTDPESGRLALHISNHQDPARAIEFARAASRAGIERVWLSEDLFYYGAVPVAAAIVTAVDSVTVGFSVLTPYGRHPGVLAMDIASLQSLAPGRIVLGIGSGVRARTDRMRAPWQNPTRIVRDTADTVGRLLAGETLTLKNTAVDADDLALSLAYPPSMPPVFAAAMGPLALDQAGQCFDGALLTIMAAPKYVSWAAAAVRAGAEAVARTTPEVVSTVPVRIAEDGDQARADSRRLVGRYLVRWHAIPVLRAMFTTHGLLGDDVYDAIVARLMSGADAAHVVPDEVAREYCAAGTASEAAAQLARWHAAGATSLNLELDPSISPADAERLFADLEAARSAA